MYERYWDLACRPFDHHFSPAFFFPSDAHQSAQLKLRYLVENGLGAGVLCGGIGTGKTFVASQLRHELAETFSPVIHIVYPQMPAADFLAYVASKLGGDDSPPEERGGIDQSLQRIERRLRTFAEQERRPTIIVDEAHLIDDGRVFESLQLLLNFREETGCAFSLLFVGGTILLGRLERMAQLNDRIAVRSVLEPLARAETNRYIAHRLAAAKAKREIFDRGALEAIGERSGGIPRRINRLCDLALLIGFADQLKKIGPAEIHAVAEELPPAVAA